MNYRGCQRCGKELKNVHKNRRFCGNRKDKGSCAYLHAFEKIKKRAYCSMCGKEFKRTQRSQRLCSNECRKLAEKRKCFNYLNLQPLWARDNLVKGQNG